MFGLLVSTPHIAQSAQAGDRFDFSTNRFDIDKDVRSSTSGWNVDESVRRKNKQSSKRWSLDDDVRRKDATSGFNYTPPNIER